jgi:hypothetical protein
MGILGTLLTVVGAVVSLIPGFQPVGLALMAAGGVVGAVEAKREAKRQRRAQVDKYNASLEDRLETIQAETAARRVVLGRVRVGGVIAFAGTTGTNKEKLYLAVLLAGHRVQAIEDIWFDEQKLTLDGSGIVQDAPYMQGSVKNGLVTQGISPGAPTITLPNTPIASSVVVKITGDYVSGQGNPQIILPISVSGNVVTVTGGLVGTKIASVSYQYNLGTPHARVYKFDGTQTTTPAVLAAAFPTKFTSAHKFTGQALIVLELTFNADVFPRGIPKITATVAGALVDDPRANLLVQSAAFDNAIWSKSSSTVTANAAIAPDGTNTAEKCVTTAATSGGVFQNVTVTPGQVYTFSFFAKATGTETAAGYRIYNNTGAADIIPATSYFSQINTATWTRIVVTFTAPAGCTSVRVYVMADVGGTIGAFVWGAQVEQRAFATDYTATTTAARTPTTAFSENPALLLAHYASHPLGGRLPSTAANLPRLTAAANRCDEITGMYRTLDSTGTAYGPSSVPLFTAAIVAESDKRPADIMDELAEAMAGRWCIAGGELLIRAGELGDTVDTITEDWLAGGVQIRAQRPRQELSNTIRGTFSSVQQNYQPTQFPQVQDATMLAAHGGELAADVQFDAVTRGGQCQYLAAIMLRELRQGMVVTIVCNLRAYRLQVFDVVAVTIARYGWTAKLFEITDRTFTADGGIKLTLRETAAGIFDQSTTFSSRDIAPNTDLPNPFDVPTVTGMSVTSGAATALLQQDGTIVPRALVSWTALTNANILSGGYVEVRYGLPDVDEAQWTSIDVNGADSSALIGPLQDQTIYVFKARAKSPLVRGAWSTQVSHKVAVRGAAGQIAAWYDGTGALAQWSDPVNPALWDAGDPVSYALPVGSVGVVQLVDGAATSEKLASGAATTEKIAPLAATEVVSFSAVLGGTLIESGLTTGLAPTIEIIPEYTYTNKTADSTPILVSCTVVACSAAVDAATTGEASVYLRVTPGLVGGFPGAGDLTRASSAGVATSTDTRTFSTGIILLGPGSSYRFAVVAQCSRTSSTGGNVTAKWGATTMKIEVIKR